MFIIVDLITVLIIALFTFLGYKQGLVKAAIKILSFFIAIVVAITIYKPISKIIIEKTSIDDNIKGAITEKLQIKSGDKENDSQIEGALADKIIGEANSTIDDIAETFTVKLIESITLLLIFLLIRIAVRFITILADLITKLPLINQINKLRTEHYMDL